MAHFLKLGNKRCVSAGIRRAPGVGSHPDMCHVPAHARFPSEVDMALGSDARRKGSRLAGPLSASPGHFPVPPPSSSVQTPTPRLLVSESQPGCRRPATTTETGDNRKHVGSPAKVERQQGQGDLGPCPVRRPFAARASTSMAENANRAPPRPQSGARRCGTAAARTCAAKPPTPPRPGRCAGGRGDGDRCVKLTSVNTSFLSEEGVGAGHITRVGNAAVC